MVRSSTAIGAVVAVAHHFDIGLLAQGYLYCVAILGVDFINKILQNETSLLSFVFGWINQNVRLPRLGCGRQWIPFGGSHFLPCTATAWSYNLVLAGAWSFISWSQFPHCWYLLIDEVR